MNREIIETELQFKAVRSSGAGGQNVNKVSSKVILFYDINNSSGLNDDEKNIVNEKLVNRISQEGILQLASSEDRSQIKNKEIVIKRFFELLSKIIKKPKTRKETKVPKDVKEKRLQEKKKSSEVKENRKKPNF